MLPAKRQQQILKMLDQQEVVKLTELTTHFNLSLETVRRDVNLLEKSGKIEKVYGGIKKTSSSIYEEVMSVRMHAKQDEKKAIGKTCSDFINDGDCIFIDSGSTTFHIANSLQNKKNLTVITNSILVANILLPTDADIIMIGGKVRNSEQSIVTHGQLFQFNQLNITKSFICAGGITVQNGISDYDMLEALTRQQIIARSKHIYVAADHTKFASDAPIHVATLSQISAIITTTYLEDSIKDTFEASGTTIIRAMS